MKNKTQKDFFINGEGDEYLTRNKRNESINLKNMQVNKQVIKYLNTLPIPHDKKIKVLEIGCGQGSMLFHLMKEKKWEFYGIDPSLEAIKLAKNYEINAYFGTADNIPFKENEFDLLIFGWCLYLCDIKDLFKIGQEANRVTKPKSWICIVDFWSPELTKIPYRHKDGIFTNKFDFSKIFKWHPFYTIYDHQIRDQSNCQYTDEKNNWLSITTLRKMEV